MARRKTRTNKFPLKALIIPAIILGIILALAGLSRIFFIRCPYFGLKEINIEGSSEEKYLNIRQGLLGKNIFLLRLEGLKREIETLFPDASCELIERRLPDGLRIVLRKRQAIAQIKKAGRFYLVDRSAMIMDSVSEAAFLALPVISGLEDKIKEPKPGYSYNIKELNNALELIRRKNESPLLGSYKLVRIDFSKGGLASLFILEGAIDTGPARKKDAPRPLVEIKFDPEKPLETIKMLALLLSKRGFSIENLEYIDLKNLNSPVLLEKKEKIKT